MAGPNASGQPPETQPAEVSRLRRLQGFYAVYPPLAAFLLIAISVNHFFILDFFVGFTLLDNQYLFILIGLLVPLVYLYWPARPSLNREKVPVYDLVLALILGGLCIWFVIHGNQVVDDGWEYEAPPLPTILSGVLWLLMLEATRRAGGWPIFFICLTISLYPLYADQAPGPLKGNAHDLEATARYHAMSTESIFGIPMRAFGNVVIGFLIFGAALAHSGAGKFFINLAFALLGKVRGGPAKVAIFSSGLMGSMSGSVISNVMTTGVMSIPAMRRVGLSPAHAGGVEACASTGGVLMPPIMGATAFVMATFLRVDYVDVALAAIIPSLLYFFGLFVQIDAYAARHDLKGLPAPELPSLRKTLAEGWYYVAVLALLVWLLIFLKRETTAPFYATALLIFIDVSLKLWRREKVGFDYFRRFLDSNARLLAELAGILGGVGLIVGAMAFTGLSGTIANDLVQLAGGSVIVLLLMGAAVSFVLGIGMTVTAAYIFLAIALAPALIKGGLDPMAVHMFIFYWGMLSYITPPVALGAFAAATVAGARPMRTGLEAMKLGTIIYFIPFFFALDPALIMKGEAGHVLLMLVQALIGTVLVAAALQGYLIGIGSLARHAVLQWPVRVALLVGGIVLVLPGGAPLPWSDLTLDITALVLIAPAIALGWVTNRGRVL
jgi:TRAP transporter 4TM/12TM fusion protein